MPTRRNIVFVINEYNGHGGAQRVAAVLAEEFVQDGHDVKVLSINEQKDASSYFSEGIPVHVLHSDGYRAPMAKNIGASLKTLNFKRIKVEIKRRFQLNKRKKNVSKFFDTYGNKDVYVIIIQVWGMQWVEELLFRPNIKIIGQSHESVKAAKGSHRYKRLLKYYRQISKFLLLTHKDAKYFEKRGFQNVGVMYNPAPFRKQVDASRLYKNKTVVSTGRLIDDKGFDVLIEAFARVAKDIPDWKLHIYGEGPAKRYLKSLIKILEVEDRVFLKGQTGDVQSVLAQSSFFVLSSKAEGLPMSLIEAQSTGLPCISTDCAPGIREIIREYKDGLLAPIGDVPVLARHIRRLALDPAKFHLYSQQAFENSLKFDKQVIKNQWYDLFEELGGSPDAK